jgi:hypothetical protein
MVRWYDPRLLTRVAARTIVSSIAGQYADQRLIQAASDQATVPELKARYDYSKPDAPLASQRIAVDGTGTYWIDYMADTGDGFESTYAMAYLLSQDSVTVNEDGKSGRTLTAGDILILGGDQCYPQASREEYKQRLLKPFNWAFDTAEPKRKLFAIPGNHDWYDGLNAFDSLFCGSRDRLSEAGEKGTRIGGWRCQQHRSYWAIKLPHNWWIWGTDIQFSQYLDEAQVSYFEMMAGEMRPGDNLIICMAEPSWMLADFQGEDEEANFFKITTIARAAGAQVRAVVAGDWHHYARYHSPEHDVHLITAGGGGSFLHPTHVLKNAIKIEWPEQTGEPTPAKPGTLGPPLPAGWEKRTTDVRLGIAGKGPAPGTVRETIQGVGEAVEQAVQPLERALAKKKARPRILKPSAPKAYPERGRSRLLGFRNLLFPLYNIPFAILIGLIYWLITWEFYSVVAQHDISAGKIDAVGTHTTFWEVYSFLPLYLIQALLVSIPLALLMGILLVCLTMYAGQNEHRGGRRIAKRIFVGGTHFAAHVATMFALGLFFVMANNWISPRIEPHVNAAWRTAAAGTSAFGKVVKEIFEPISADRKAQREMFGGTPERGQIRRSAPPASAMPKPEPGQPPYATPNSGLESKSVRQILGFILYPFEMIVLGGIVGGLVWGFYWVICSVFLRMHAEDAFAALRIKHYKNFLRFKFEPHQVTIYPIGVDRIPNRRFWHARRKSEAISHNPQLVASEPILVRLIEKPIVLPNVREEG